MPGLAGGGQKGSLGAGAAECVHGGLPWPGRVKLRPVLARAGGVVEVVPVGVAVPGG